MYIINTEALPRLAQIAWAGFMSGIGNLIWVPAASAFGRRPIILISCAGCFACVLWFGRVSHYRSMLASRIVLGLFMAPIECFAPMQIGVSGPRSQMPAKQRRHGGADSCTNTDVRLLMIIQDMFFTSQRARAHSVFFIILLISTSIGGAISGAFADSHVGWRGYFYFNAGMVASAFILVLFLMPETAFRRTAASSRGVHGGAEKQAAVSTPELEEDKKEVAAAASADADVESLTVEYVGKGFPNKAQRFGLLAGRDKTYSPFNAWWRVLQAITIWPIWLCIGWFGSIKGILVGQNYVAAQIWQAPPYNFTNAQVGMVNIPAIVGTVTGAIFWGWFSDWDLARRTRNNGGIREPEMRLWPILPGAIIGVIGGVIYGLGAERQWRWEIILIVGNTVRIFSHFSTISGGRMCSADARSLRHSLHSNLVSSTGSDSCPALSAVSRTLLIPITGSEARLAFSW